MDLLVILNIIMIILVLYLLYKVSINVGPQGPQGLQGDQGLQGPPGEIFFNNDKVFRMSNNNTEFDFGNYFVKTNGDGSFNNVNASQFCIENQCLTIDDLNKIKKLA